MPLAIYPSPPPPPRLLPPQAGLWLAATPGMLPSLFVAGGAPWPEAQSLAAEALSQLTSDDAGRSLLAGAADAVASAAPAATRARLDGMALLARLADAASPAVRR